MVGKLERQVIRGKPILENLLLDIYHDRVSSIFGRQDQGIALYIEAL
jgi:hypothetical protein